jgi:hypothetical protein
MSEATQHDDRTVGRSRAGKAILVAGTVSGPLLLAFVA